MDRLATFASTSRIKRAVFLIAGIVGIIVAAGVTHPASADPAAIPAGARPSSQYDDAFRKYSKRYFGPGFDWRVFKAQAMAESHLDPAATSACGARGLMQLMPMTFREIQSKNPEFQSIDDPVFNIAAGISYDSQLWNLWKDLVDPAERTRFVMGSYNAGRTTLLRARTLAESHKLDPHVWTNIRTVAPEVPRWNHRETIGYIDRIELNQKWLCGGEVIPPR